MRILMSTDTVSGVWTYALQLSRELAARGVQVILATLGPRPTDAQRRQIESLPRVWMCESTYRLEWMADPWVDLQLAGQWLMDLATQWEPEIVHLNHYAHGNLGCGRPCLVVGHSCVYSWHEAVRKQIPGAEWQRYRQVVAAGLRGADMVVAPTAAMLHCLRKWYGPLGNCRVVPHGLPDPATGSPTATKQPLVFSTGRLWDDAQNIAAVAQVAPRIRWPVFVASVPHPAGRAKTPSGVRPLGRLASAEVRQWYAKASIFALPARYEPFGMAPLEAASAGCALVLGDIPSLREVWDDAAVWVPPDDTSALQHALEALIQDAELRQVMAERARERARHFTARRMVNIYLQTCRQLFHRWSMQPSLELSEARRCAL